MMHDFLRRIPLVLMMGGMLCFFSLSRAQTQRITLSFTRTDLGTLLQEMSKQSNLPFSYDKSVMSKVRVDHIDWKAVPLREALSGLARRTGLEYNISDGMVALKLGTKPAGAAQTLKGRIVDFETAQPLPGATVSLGEGGRTTQADDKGYYEFKDIPEGTYQLTVTYSGYQKNVLPNIPVKGDRERVQDVKMQVGGTLSEVVIAAGPRKVMSVTHTTDKQLLQEIRNATGSVSGISNEAIVKTPDRNAAEVVKRISGVTVVDQRFIVVRGMNERYNITYLNGNIAPSTELYNKAFSYDLLPSSILDKILVYKSPVADLSAEYAGAAVKIFTKEPMAVRHFDIGVQLAHRPGSTLSNIISYTGGKYDVLGFDDGSRKLPGFAPGYIESKNSASNVSQAALVSAFSPILDYGYKHSLPDMQYYANYYNGWRLGKHAWLYDLTSATYTLETTNYAQYRQTGNTYAWVADGGDLNIGDAGQITHTEQSTQDAKFNVLENLTLKFNKNHSLQFKNFFVNDGQVLTAVNDMQRNVDSIFDAYPRYKNIILSYQQRTLYAGNLGGSDSWHSDKTKLDWNLGYTYNRQNVPDQRISTFAATGPQVYGQTPEPAALVYTAAGSNMDDYNDGFEGMISRLFIRTLDNVYNGSMDWTQRLSSVLTMKLGTYDLFKTRDVNRRFFRVNRAGLGPDETYDPQSSPGWPGDNGVSNPNIIQFRLQQLPTIWNVANFPSDNTGLELYDATTPADRYVASEQNNAFYWMGDWAPLRRKLSVNAGLRVEYDRMKLAGAEVTQGILTGVNIDRPVTSWLPSVNLTYRPGETWVVRAGYGRTVDRQDFRELTPYNDYDFQNHEEITGNPNLVNATIDNVDGRLEWYPKSSAQNEVFEVGAFYKFLRHPIERMVFQQDGYVDVSSFPGITFSNADFAKVYGVEAEAHKNLSFIGGGLWRNLSLVVNGSLIHSLATEYAVVSGSTVADTFPNVKGRPLQGQAPYVLNAGLFYENPAWGTKLGVVYNVTGPIIYAKSIANPNQDSTSSVFKSTDPDVLELPRHLLDFSVTQRIVKSLQVKASIQNILNQPIRQVQDWNYNQKYDPEQPHIGVRGAVYYTGDNIYFKYNPGRYYILSFTYAL